MALTRTQLAILETLANQGGSLPFGEGVSVALDGLGDDQPHLTTIRANLRRLQRAKLIDVVRQTKRVDTLSLTLVGRRALNDARALQARPSGGPQWTRPDR